MGLLAFGLLALAQQPAAAWVNSKFSIGLNASCQSGNNSFFWGLYKNGQLPGPEAYGIPPVLPVGAGDPSFAVPDTHMPHAYAPYVGAPYAYSSPAYVPYAATPNASNPLMPLQWAPARRSSSRLFQGRLTTLAEKPMPIGESSVR